MPRDASPATQTDAYAELSDRFGIGKVAVVAISAGAWSSLQFAIRHPQRCRAVVFLVTADYLPAGTAIHGGALARAIFGSNFVASAAARLTRVMPGALAPLMLGADLAVLRAAAPSEGARLQRLLNHLLLERALGRDAIRRRYRRHAGRLSSCLDCLPGADDRRRG